MNGQTLAIPNPSVEYVIQPGINPKLKPLAITLWTMAAGFAVGKPAEAASPLWDGSKPLIHFFQDVAMFLGSLALIAGLILLGFKKRWGVNTIKTTAFVVVGVFLVPSALVLLAIIGGYMDSALSEALQQMRESKAVIGGK